MIHVLPEETGPRHGGHADLPDHPLAELQVCPAPEEIRFQELRDIHHHEVRALGHIVPEADPVQAFQKIIALARICPVQVPIILLPEAQPGNGRFLQRCRRSHGQEIVDLFCVLHYFRRPAHISASR